MNTPFSFRSVREFLKKHRVRILTAVVLLLLSIMSYVICKKPTQTILITEWAARSVLPFVAVLSIGSAVCARYAASLFLFIGYHVGIVYAALTLEATSDMLLYAKFTVLAILLAFCILGVWSEIFSILIPRWKKKASETEP